MDSPPQDSQLSQPTQAVQPDVDSNSASSSQSSPANPKEDTYTEIPLPEQANNADMIEKEWVERVKQVVAHTKQDPYEQQRALSQMKADYLKKRYNKDIKISEG